MLPIWGLLAAGIWFTLVDKDLHQGLSSTVTKAHMYPTAIKETLHIGLLTWNFKINVGFFWRSNLDS